MDFKEIDFKKKTIIDFKEMDFNEIDFKEMDFKKKIIMDFKERILMKWFLRK